jgi:hypothetical protein
VLPPTTPELLEPHKKPYFLWWLDCTVAEFKARLESPNLAERAYYLGALLREANTRDVWCFTTPEQVRGLWPAVERHLGRTRDRWAWLLDIEDADAP